MLVLPGLLCGLLVVGAEQAMRVGDGWTSLLRDGEQTGSREWEEGPGEEATTGEDLQEQGWTSLRDASRKREGKAVGYKQSNEGDVVESKVFGFPQAGYYSPSQLFQLPSQHLAPSPPPLGPLLPTIFQSNLPIHPATNPFSGGFPSLPEFPRFGPRPATPRPMIGPTRPNMSGYELTDGVDKVGTRGTRWPRKKKPQPVHGTNRKKRPTKKPANGHHYEEETKKKRPNRRPENQGDKKKRPYIRPGNTVLFEDESTNKRHNKKPDNKVSFAYEEESDNQMQVFEDKFEGTKTPGVGSYDFEDESVGGEDGVGGLEPFQDIPLEEETGSSNAASMAIDSQDLVGRMERMEEIFNSLRITSKGCQARLVCHLAKDPATFSPLSHLVLDNLDLEGLQQVSDWPCLRDLTLFIFVLPLSHFFSFLFNVQDSRDGEGMRGDFLELLQAREAGRHRLCYNYSPQCRSVLPSTSCRVCCVVLQARLFCRYKAEDMVSQTGLRAWRIMYRILTMKALARKDGEFF